MPNLDPQDVSWSELAIFFSRERMSVYLDVSQGDHKAAKQLFLWNSKVAALFWEVIGLVEVAVRCTVDSQLSKAFPANDWLESNVVFSESDQIWKIITNARERVGGSIAGQRHHQVIQQLPLGFFQVLISKRYLRIWPDLASGFKGGDRGSHKELSQLMQFFREFRNRIGHHDLLNELDLGAAHDKLLRIAALVDPRLETWISQVSEVPKLRNKRPQDVGAWRENEPVS